MNHINRNGCVVCENTHLETLEPMYTSKSFPVFVGCTETESDTDLRMDMSWVICPNCGTIQLDKLVPLDILYQENHSEAIGSIWQNHHAEFADFILEYGKESRLEIGGSNGRVAQLARNKNESGRWLILEPNILETTQEISNTEFQQGWFDDKYQPPFKIDTVIHSHVIEHWYEPRQTLAQINKLLQIGDKMIFSVPNMKVWLKAKYTNCLSFEHSYYLPEDVVEFLVGEFGFKVIAKKYFQEHSIFFACEKLDKELATFPQLPKNYQENKALYEDFIDYYIKLVNGVQDKLAKYQGLKYIFGAHIFTLSLLGFGLKQEDFLSVLDNSPVKIGKRLYGTNLMVNSPKCLKDHQEALVVLKAGNYTDEIKQDVLENINSNILFV